MFFFEEHLHFDLRCFNMGPSKWVLVKLVSPKMDLYQVFKSTEFLGPEMAGDIPSIPRHLGLSRKHLHL